MDAVNNTNMQPFLKAYYFSYTNLFDTHVVCDCCAYAIR